MSCCLSDVHVCKMLMKFSLFILSQKLLDLYFFPFLFAVVASSNESQQCLLSTVQHEMAQRRIQKSNGNAVKNGTNGTMNPMPVFTGNPAALMTRQDSRLSVKSLIESIENTSKQTKEGSQSGSMTSLNSLTAMDQQIDSQSPSATEQEKQQNTLNNNSITSNNNGVNGSQRNRGMSPSM